jgi:hypothetical protein
MRFFNIYAAPGVRRLDEPSRLMGAPVVNQRDAHGDHQPQADREAEQRPASQRQYPARRRER